MSKRSLFSCILRLCGKLCTPRKRYPNDALTRKKHLEQTLFRLAPLLVFSEPSWIPCGTVVVPYRAHSEEPWGTVDGMTPSMANTRQKDFLCHESFRECTVSAGLLCGLLKRLASLTNSSCQRQHPQTPREPPPLDQQKAHPQRIRRSHL